MEFTDAAGLILSLYNAGWYHMGATLSQWMEVFILWIKEK